MDDKTTVATKGRTRFNCCGTVFEGTHAEMQDAAIGHKCATVESLCRECRHDIHFLFDRCMEVMRVPGGSVNCPCQNKERPEDG